MVSRILSYRVSGLWLPLSRGFLWTYPCSHRTFTNPLILVSYSCSWVIIRSVRLSLFLLLFFLIIRFLPCLTISIFRTFCHFAHCRLLIVWTSWILLPWVRSLYPSFLLLGLLAIMRRTSLSLIFVFKFYIYYILFFSPYLIWIVWEGWVGKFKHLKSR